LRCAFQFQNGVPVFDLVTSGFDLQSLATELREKGEEAAHHERKKKEKKGKRGGGSS